MNEPNETYETEIDLLDLIAGVLSRWRGLLLAGLCGLLLLGGYKYMKAESQRTAYEAALSGGNESVLLQNASYKAASDAVTEKQKANNDIRSKIAAKKVEISAAETVIRDSENAKNAALRQAETFEKQKEGTEEKLRQYTEYLNASVLQKADPMAYPEARRTYQVILSEGKEDLFRDPTDEILSAYTGSGQYLEAFGELAEKYGLDTRCLSEICSVSSDISANSFTVTAAGTDLAMAEDIADTVAAKILSGSEQIAERYRPHTLTETKRFSREYVSTSVSDAQNAAKEQILAFEKQIAECEANIATKQAAALKAEEDIANQEEKLSVLGTDLQILEDSFEKGETELEGLLEKKTKNTFTRSQSIRSGIKFGLIGLLAGVFVLALWYCMCYVLEGTVHTAEELKNCLRIPVIAVLSKKQKHNGPLDRLIRRIGGEKEGASDAEKLSAAAVTVSSLLGDGTKAALLSTCTGGEPEEIRKALSEAIPGAEFFVVPGTEAGKEDCEKLKASDKVILLEKRGSSLMKEIIAEKEKAALLGKEIVGCIVL